MSGQGIGRVVVVLLALPVTAMTVVRLLGLGDGFPLAPVLTIFPWVVLLGVAPLAGAAALRWQAGLVATLVVTLVGVALLLPRVLPNRQPDAAGPVVTVAVANLRLGLGDADAVVATVDAHEVDVLVVPELSEDAVGRLAAAGLDDRLEPVLIGPSRLTSGIGVWTNLEAEVTRDRGADSDDRRRFSRGTVEVELTTGGSATVLLSAVHPLPPINPDWTEDWATTLAELPPAEDDVLRILAGDLNATLDHAALRDVLDRGYVDAAAERGTGWRPTFNGLPWGEPVPPVTLDHVLVDQRIAVRGATTSPLPNSDHRIVIARLELPANAT